MNSIGNYVGGRAVAPRSGRWFPSELEPGGFLKLPETADSGPADVEDALSAARQGQTEWAAQSRQERGEVLRAAATSLRRRLDEAAHLISHSVGKPLHESRAEVENAARVLDYYGGLADTPDGTILPSRRRGVQLYTSREPLGIAAAITPWNFPINIPIVKLAPALLEGNAVILKPARLAASCGMLIADVLGAAGLPSGGLAVVNGSGSEVGSYLAGHDEVSVVSFTGSTEVGHLVRRSSSDRGARCICEMGGKNALVVMPDADLELTVEAIVEGAYRYAGQKCTATSIVIVVGEGDQTLSEALVARIEQLKIGLPLDEATFVGPLISEASVSRALHHVEEAKRAGATVIIGGEPAFPPGGRAGCFMQPTLIADVEPAMSLASVELFAPIVGMMRVDSLTDAASVVNCSPYGLTVAVFTRDLAPAGRFAEIVDVGSVQVNLPTSGLEYQMPYSGRRESGSGGAEGGTDALLSYSKVKSVAVRPI